MYVLRTYCYIYRHTCVVARSVVNIQHLIGSLVHGLVVFSWYDVITCQSSVHTFRRFFYNILIFDVPQYSHIFHCIKDIRPAIYFDNQKNHCISSLKQNFCISMVVFHRPDEFLVTVWKIDSNIKNLPYMQSHSWRATFVILFVQK